MWGRSFSFAFSISLVLHTGAFFAWSYLRVAKLPLLAGRDGSPILLRIVDQDPAQALEQPMSAVPENRDHLMPSQLVNTTPVREVVPKATHKTEPIAPLSVEAINKETEHPLTQHTNQVVSSSLEKTERTPPRHARLRETAPASKLAKQLVRPATTLAAFHRVSHLDAPASRAEGNNAGGSSHESNTGPRPFGDALAPPGFQPAAPRYGRDPPPVYPAEARRRGQEGLVVVRAHLDERGVPAEVTLKASCAFDLLDQAALAAVREWRFIPAHQGPHPVAADVEIPIRFEFSP